jgi:hypothetical protein
MRYVVGPNGENICTIPFSVMLSMEAITANAHLIAAAPDLLAAIIAWDLTLSEFCDGPERDAVRAAISKATGE